jgi:hypothetical protein
MSPPGVPARDRPISRWRECEAWQDDPNPSRPRARVVLASKGPGPPRLPPRDDDGPGDRTVSI